jgi:hypothetical protein
MTAKLFRKKPVVIEAYQFNNFAGSAGERPRWLIDAVEAGTVWYQGGEKPYLTIQTLEGQHRADLGDWIIKGVKGELYPCKPEIFAMTYDAVEGAAA